MSKQSPSHHYELIQAQEAIRSLEQSLREARQDLINLIPFNLSSILSSYYSCLDRSEAQDWEGNVVERIISTAKILSYGEGLPFGDTAFCPLCGRGSSDFYERGFTYPEGLRRHLVGFGNARQCIPMKTAHSLAIDYWNKKFTKEDEKEREQKITEEAERRRTEILYVLSLDGEPKLIDNNSHFSPPRDETQLLWAEARLLDLKFTTVNEGNVKSYIKEFGDYIIYADPLSLGRIEFRLYKKTQGKGRRRASENWPVGNYVIQDKWKNNLSTKLELFVSKAMEQKAKDATKATR